MQGENVLIVDVASGSTGVALVRLNKGALPVITAQAREDSLGTALNVLAKNNKTPISRALIALSSPFLNTHLKTIILAKAEGFVFNQKALEGVMEEEKELFISRIKAGNKEESKVFESALTSLYLNGYETSAPSRERVKKAELSFIMSSAPKTFIHKAEESLIESFGIHRGATLHSFMYAFYKVLTHSFHDLHSALLVNIGADFTDILFIRHGNSALSASLPFGPNLITQAVAEELDLPLPIAESYLALLARGELDQSTVESINLVLKGVEQRWQELWQKMDESIPEDQNVPYTIFLVAPKGQELILKVFLEGVLPSKHIILLGETNTFTKELVAREAGELGDEKLSILAGFSNLLN